MEEEEKKKGVEEEEVVPVFVQVVAQQAHGVGAEHLEDKGLLAVLGLDLQCDDVTGGRRLLAGGGSESQSAAAEPDQHPPGVALSAPNIPCR